MYKFRKFLKGLGYSFVYLLISIASAYGVINLSISNVRGETQTGADTPLPEQISSIVEHFSASSALDLGLNAIIEADGDNYEIGLDAVVDLSGGLENIKAEGSINAVIGMGGESEHESLSQSETPESITVGFSYQNSTIYLDMFNSKLMMECTNLMDTLNQVLAFANVDLESMGVTEILNMPINDMLKMLSNIKEETKDEETGLISMVVALPMVGDATLVCDENYKLLGLHSDMAISEGLSVKVNSNIDYPTNLVIEEKTEEEYVNAGNLLEVANPLLNYLENTQFALDLDITSQTGTGEYQKVANGKLYLDIEEGKAKFVINVMDNEVKIYFIENTIYLEYQNVYTKFALNDFEKVQTMLTNSFDLTLPQEIINILESLTKGAEITLPNGVSLDGLDLNAIDLSIVENVEIKNDATIITLRDIGIIRLNANDGNLKELAYSGFGYQGVAKVVEYQDFNLSQINASYIDLATFIPTIENAISIAKCQSILGQIKTNIMGEEIVINLAFSPALLQAHASTEIMGLNLDVYYSNNNLYINFANKFKFVCDMNTFLDDILAFLSRIGLDLSNPEGTEITDKIALIFNPSITPLFITNLTQTENGFDITLFNDTTLYVENDVKQINISTTLADLDININLIGSDEENKKLVFNDEEYTSATTLLNIAEKVYKSGILKLITPAINTFTSNTLGLEINTNLGDLAVKLQANVNLTNKSLSLTTNILGIDAAVLYQDGKVYLELGNVYITFALEDFDRVCKLLEDSFKITLPSEIIKMAISMLTTDSIDIKEVIEMVDFDLSNLDLSILDNLKVEENKADLTISNNIFTINFTQDEILGFNLEGEISANAIINDYQEKALSTEENNYINATTFLPIIDNANAIMNSSKVFGRLILNIDGLSVDASMVYDNDNAIASFNTQIEGIDIAIYLKDNNVYTNIADKFKFVTSITTFEQDIQLFLEQIGVDLTAPETNEILNFALNILSPNVNPLLIKKFTQTSSGAVVTLFNDITFAIVNGNDEIAINSAFDDGSIFFVLSTTTQEVTIPQINVEDYCDTNIILNIISSAYNAGLTKLITPAFNTFISGNIGLNLTLPIAEETLNANVNLSIADKTFALTSEINSSAIKVLYRNETIYIEYGNLYFNVSFKDLDTISNFLNANFGIELPNEIISKLISIVTADSITPAELLESFDLDFNLADLDLSFFENITISQTNATIKLDGNSIGINFNENEILGFSFNNINATVTEFTEVGLTTNEDNYIALTDFLPIAENSLKLIENDVLSGTINTTIENTDVELTFSYSKVNNTAIAYTEVMGIKLNMYFVNNKVYVNLANKFKLVSNTSTFIEDITSFLDNLDVNTEVDMTSVLTEVANILNPVNNTLLIKDFVKEDGLIMLTLFNDISVSINHSQDMLAFYAEVETIPVNIKVEKGVEFTLPTINEEDYTDINVLLNIIASAYNAGLANLISPALNTFANGEIGLNLVLPVENETLNANVNLSVVNKSLSLTSQINNTALKVVYNNGTIFIEYGNVYFNVSLKDFEYVSSFLSANFGIELPTEIISELIGFITAESISPVDMIKNFDLDFNLANFDLSLFEKIKISDTDAVIEVEDNKIIIKFNEDEILSFAFNNIHADITTFTEVDLATAEENYIALTNFLPIVQDGLKLLENDVISGKIKTTIENIDIELAFSYSQTSNTAIAYTEIMGIKLNVYYKNNKIYINVADKFKLVSDTSTFIDDITSFMNSMKFNLNVDTEALFNEIANILSPANNNLFFKTFDKGDGYLTIELFNDMMVSLTHSTSQFNIKTEFENIPIEIIIEQGETFTLPNIVENDYTNTAVLLNIISAAHNAGLTNLIAPSINTFKEANVGATFEISYDELTINGHLSINALDLTAGVNVNVRGINLNIIVLADNVAYIEFGNVYAKFAVIDLPKVGDLLNKHFGIDLPLTEIVEILLEIRDGSFNPIEMLDKFNITIDLASIDLSFFDNITVANNEYFIPVDGIGDFSLSTGETLTGFGYEGFGIKVDANINEYKVFDLTLLKEEYIDLAYLLPTVDNAIDTVAFNTLSGQIVINDLNANLRVPIDYVVSKDSEVYVSFSTNIYGANIAGKYYKEKVYLEFAESVDIVVDVLNLPNALKELMDSAGKNIQTDLFVKIQEILENLLNGETSSIISTAVGVFDNIKSIFDKTSTEILIKSLTKTNDGLIITMYNDMLVSISNKTAQIDIATTIDNIELSINLKGSNDAVVIPTINDNDYIPVENILELVKAFFNMTHKDDFNINGNIDIAGDLVGININMTVGLNAQVKLVDGKVQFQAILGEIPAIVGVNNDVPYKFGDTESGSDRYVYLYFDGNDLYIYRSEYVDIVFGASKRHYEKCTKISAETLLADPMYYLQYMIGFTDAIMGAIEDAMIKSQNRENPIDLNNVVNSLACSGETFDLILNLAEIANNNLLDTLDLNLLLNKDYEDKSYLYRLGLDVYLPLADIFKLTLSSDDITIVDYGSTVDLSRLQQYVTSYKYNYGEEWEASNESWEKAADKQYTIYFEENGGDTQTDITGIYGSAITLPTYTNPLITDDGVAKTTATFAGWYTTSNFKEGTLFTETTMPRKDTVLYAKWNKNILYYRTIKFVTNSSDVVNSITQLEGTTVVVPYLDTKQVTNGDVTITYSFGGWYLDSTCKEKFTTYQMPSESIVLYAKWDFVKEEITKTFTLYDNGAQIYSYRIKEGDAIDLSRVSQVVLTGNYPTLFYYDSAFASQYTGALVMPSENLTLHIRNAYTLTIYSQYGNKVNSSTKVYQGESVSLPSQSSYVDDVYGSYKTTYTFSGYDNQPTQMPNSDTSITAVWNIDTKYYYTITFDTSLKYIPKSCAAGCKYKEAPGSISSMVLLEGTVIDLTQSKYQLSCQVWATAISWGVSYSYISTTWVTSVPNDYSDGGSGLTSYTVTGNATLYPFWEKQ